MPIFRGLINAVAPEIENTQEAMVEDIAGLTFANSSRLRVSVAPQPRPATPAQTTTPQRAETSSPPATERNPARPGYTRRIQQIQQEHQFQVARQLQKHRRRATSPSDAEISNYLRATRPGLETQQNSREHFRGNPTIQEVASREDRPAIHEGLYHPQPRRVVSNMAGTRRTGLDAAAANPPRITSHQIFLKSQVKRQQDATDEWARRTGKSAPPFQFEDFIGKGAYGRVFRA